MMEMKKQLSIYAMFALIVAAILIVVSIFFPWWGMKFYAPQYPEGLDIIVYPFKLEGQIDIINGLNHYIGMKPFSEEDFPELNFLPYIIGAFALFTLLVAILRNKKALYFLIGTFVIGAVIGIYDIHRWLKAYGTNLDPQAPITVDPFVPPILGENTIANFITNSYFTYGSFIIAAAFLCMLFPLWKDRKK
jgi:copper chaperone NosL